MENIKMVLNENSFNEKTSEIVIPSGRHGHYCKRIYGVDVGLHGLEYSKRTLEPSDITGHWISYILEEGKVYEWFNGGNEKYGTVKDGLLYEISQSDVKNLVPRL